MFLIGPRWLRSVKELASPLQSSNHPTYLVTSKTSCSLSLSLFHCLALTYPRTHTYTRTFREVLSTQGTHKMSRNPFFRAFRSPAFCGQWDRQKKFFDDFKHSKRFGQNGVIKKLLKKDFSSSDKFVFKNGPIPASFCLFLSLFLVTISIIQIEKA